MSRLKVSALRRDPLPIFKELAARGDISELSLGRDPGFLVSDPDAIENVLVAQARNFAHEPVLHPRWLGLPVEGRGGEREALITLAPAPGFVLRLEPRERSGGPDASSRQREELRL